jgi:hypothetical protein
MTFVFLLYIGYVGKFYCPANKLCNEPRRLAFSDLCDAPLTAEIWDWHCYLTYSDVTGLE